MQEWKLGLTNHRWFLMDHDDVRKGTSRITGLSPPIVHIDGAVWYIAVGSSYPGCAQASKGVGVHALKGIVSWVKNVVRQFVWYLLDVSLFEWKDPPVREERGFGASGLPVVMSRLGSYALSDKCWKHLSTKRTAKRNNISRSKRLRW